MERRVLFLWLIAVLGAASAPATPFIVDTGPGDSINALSEMQWLAGEFTLNQNYTVTSVEGWIAYLHTNTSTPITLVIYGDGGDVPDTGSRFFEQSFGMPTATRDRSDWHGPSNLELELAAGTYWAAFEVRPNCCGIGLGRMDPTIDPQLANYAIWQPATGWAGNDDVKLGLRISVVPEPSTGGLLALGLVGVSVRRRHRTRRWHDPVG